MPFVLVAIVVHGENERLLAFIPCAEQESDVTHQTSWLGRTEILLNGMSVTSGAISVPCENLLLEPDVTHQTSWLGSTGGYNVRQDQADGSSDRRRA